MNPYVGAVMAGGVAGMRSMSAPSLLGRVTDNSLVSKIATTLAVGEAIADKLPFMPKRTIPASLAARAASGAVTGAVICSSRKRSPVWGAIIGAAAAVGTTYAIFELRKRANNKLGVPDFVTALAEDALVAGVSYATVSALKA